jgi:hypothetical protein
MGVLHGQLHKQAVANGAYVPNPGTTVIPLVSRLQQSECVDSKGTNNNPFLYITLFYAEGRTTHCSSTRNAFCQLTMTQEYGKCGQDDEQQPLPPALGTIIDQLVI